jgi:hypothetical protein
MTPSIVEGVVMLIQMCLFIRYGNVNLDRDMEAPLKHLQQFAKVSCHN